MKYLSEQMEFGFEIDNPLDGERKFTPETRLISLLVMKFGVNGILDFEYNHDEIPKGLIIHHTNSHIFGKPKFFLSIN